MAEGTKVVAEALGSGASVEGLYLAAGWEKSPGAVAVVQRATSTGVRCFVLEPGVMERVADTVTPQPLLAVVSVPGTPLLALRSAGLLVVCAGVRDPGNAGVVLRSAEAAGADGVVCCHESVDLYNPKTVRASAGALFHLPVVVEGEAVGVLGQIGEWGVRRLATVARGGQDYSSVDMTGRVALVLGNEANGLDAAVAAACDAAVTIPLTGRAESLNVGVAASVLCFEAARQRRTGGVR